MMKKTVISIATTITKNIYQVKIFLRHGMIAIEINHYYKSLANCKFYNALVSQ